MTTGFALSSAQPTAPAVPQDSCRSTVAACLLGDTRAWQDFVGSYKPLITKTVHWTLQRYGYRDTLAQDTEDVTQDVFFRLVRSNYRLLETWNPQRGTLPTWLTVVSRSTAMDYIRDRRNKQRAMALHVPLDEHMDLASAPALHDGSLRLPDGILSPRQHSILHLMFEKDMTPEEVAAFLDIHPQTVRSIRHSAILKLREHYAKQS